jgi:uncharacterized protein YigA (DUF484 family)
LKQKQTNSDIQARIDTLRERLNQIKRSAEDLRAHAKEVDRIAAEIHELQGRQRRGEE